MRENLIEIEGNEYSPSISFYLNDKLIIKGESRLENPREFYEELYAKIKSDMKNTPPKFVECQFEYISSSSILSIIGFLKKINDEFQVKIVWYYEKLDEDILELGEIVKESHGIPLDIQSI